ncbi:transient receptor potential cation channel subfamily V member 5-like isoform X2 [Anneissia japonica]|uniref:transient receptor potential cation channel subfamily V member 5-like isoform X2 n=1 Tax=Anneissia japonica TaxID=1529436 RepID=UPI0014258654|nr:transient receptor potential cation channel subfamily V member 5-like isoform X2 [Anneissia japonica]
MGNISQKARNKIEFLGISHEDGPETEWRRQNKAYEQNSMYKLVYFCGKGSLIAKTKKHGASSKRMKKYVKMKVQEYLYKRGDGKELTKAEFAKYMYENNYFTVKKVDRPQSEDLIKYLEDYEKSVGFDRFKQHQVCWDLNKRGEVGETILHLCFLNNTEHHRALAYTLMECFPLMALDIYEGPEYYGEGMLHMAIINNDIESVHLLIKYHVPIDQRATGRFFCPKDMKDRAMKEKNLYTSKYEGETYFGEYPLAFAASVGSIEIYDILVNASLSAETCGKVDPNAKDNFGNTVLHMLVIHNQVHMFNYVASHKLMPADHELRNHAGLTPMELSFQLGRSELFSNLLDLASVPQWSFGEITYSAYPLSFIDTIGPNGETNEHSALRIIVRGETQEHLEMLDGEIINTLLMHKWKHYAKSKFIFKFVWTLVHLSFLSLAIYLRPKGDLMSSDANSGRLAKFDVCVVRWFAEICVLIGCVAKTIIEVREVISRGSIRSYLKSLYGMPAKSAFIIAIIMLYLCVPLRLLNLKNVEELFLSIILPFSWLYILFFYRAMKGLGPFVHMIYEMLRGDLLRFSIIYGIFIFMFSQVFFHMYKDTDVETSDTFATVHGSVMSVFKMTFGDFSDDLFDQTRHWFLSRVVFVLFAIYLPILLLNMLIAMMGRTYTIIEQKAKREWKRQLAIIILNVERAISKNDLAKMRLKYSTEIKRRRKRKKVPRKWSRANSLASIVTAGVAFNELKMYQPNVKSEEETDEEEVEETFRALMFLKRSDPASKKNSMQAKRLWKKSVKLVHHSKKVKERANSNLEGHTSELKENIETQMNFKPMLQKHDLPTVTS